VKLAPLKHLSLTGVSLWASGSGEALLTALTGHPTLASLDIRRNTIPRHRQAEVGRVLGALSAARSALKELNVVSTNLGGVGAVALFAGVEKSRGLRVLHCGYNHLERNVHSTLLASVKRNTSLRNLQLLTDYYEPPYPEYMDDTIFKQARDIVQRRRQL
jgi:hypothetical protein